MLLSLNAGPIEKICHVIEAIEHQRAISPENSVLHLSLYLLGLNAAQDLTNILNKLEKDDKAITIHARPGQMYVQKTFDGTAVRKETGYGVLPTDNFEAFSQLVKTKLKEERDNNTYNPLIAPVFKTLEIQKPTTMVSVPYSQSKVSPVDKPVGQLSIRFDDLNSCILLDEIFLISQPAYDSENYRFFAYVWKNPHRTISLDELNEKLEEPLKKSLSKILENLNFRGQLREAFFKASKTSVCFTPNRTIKELEQAGLYPLRLYTTQKAD